MSAATTILELDQEDLTARLQADPFFVDTVKVFSQRKGITENDVMTALGAVNQQGTKSGLVAIVLIPSLIPESPNAPGPYYFTRYPIQVIDWPVMRRNATTGAGMSAETLAERIRMIVHFWGTGRGQALVFDGMEPAPQDDPTKVSYILYFKKLGGDKAPVKCATVGITPASGAAPQTVTLTCATASAAIYYSTDGTYPSSQAAAATPATSFLYSAPFSVATAATVRAAAEKTNLQQGDCAQATYT